MDKYSFLNSIHPHEIEELYQKYLVKPDIIEPGWRAFFQGYDFSSEYPNELALGNNSEAIQPKNDVEKSENLLQFEKEIQVLKLIDAYRTRGHLFTKTNPVRTRRKYNPDLSISQFGLTSQDLSTEFKAGAILGLKKSVTLKEIIQHLEDIFCQSIGVEYMYMRNPIVLEWMQNRINENDNHPKLSSQDKITIYHRLCEAVNFENFLHIKYVGQKRFSLEGGETFIPAIDALIEKAADKGVQEFVIGMAHRGRLNVLANIFKKSPRQMFNEFEGKDYSEDEFDGDVKYHMGATGERVTRNGKTIKLNLVPNPSHLETVAPVVEGITRSKIDTQYSDDNSLIMPIVVHGDTAVSGQGIAYEVVQMSKLDGYKTGGTIHIIINNQIGFTTNYTDGRSSTYCTDVAKVTLSPVLHINADDVEAVVHGIKIAVDFRMKFKGDVFIDLLGYRKYGHNEGDEPRFTQPLLYKLINKHPNPKDIYLQKLLEEKVLTKEKADEYQEGYLKDLETELIESKKMEKTRLITFMSEIWTKYPLVTKIEKAFERQNTTFDKKKLLQLSEKITTLPEGVTIFNKLARLLKDRSKMLEENRVDWGMGEMLAYASLLDDGCNLRLSGQDVERGTFSHRHAVMKMEDSEEEVVLLKNISETSKVNIYNSLLSEYGVLGFDYGYSLNSPETLTIWEAQFGDFSNGAQIILDQYISAAEDKWKLQSGIVMLLPHGFEGQGAEHSSARTERYLQLCAKYNMHVMNLTTPANLFHALRDHMVRKYRKPLIIFTPKSLLRHPKCISSLEDFTNGKFDFIKSEKNISHDKIKKVIFCTGKLYYDLLEYRDTNKKDDTTIVRVEQLYPFPKVEIQEILDKYPKAKKVWAQEEPRNMGYISFLHRFFPSFEKIKTISPTESATPATGSSTRHKKKHKQLIEEIFNY